MLNGLDLFSGIGGLAVALRPWVRVVSYCERERYAQGVLLSRMRSNQIDRAPIWDDVQTLKGSMLPSVDIVFGGFPCQDLSVAGNGAGLDGKRSGLVFELLRLVSECGSKFIFLENVPALSIRGLDRLLLELDAMGFDARWTIVSASEMGAPHLRERIWIFAHANGLMRRDEREKVGRENAILDKRNSVSKHDGHEKPLAHPDRLRKPSEPERWIKEGHGVVYCGQNMADSDGINFGDVGHGDTKIFRGFEETPGMCRHRNWEFEPDVGRVAHGVRNRMDRLRGLGNAVVPQAAREAFERLSGLKNG